MEWIIHSTTFREYFQIGKSDIFLCAKEQNVSVISTDVNGISWWLSSRALILWLRFPGPHSNAQGAACAFPFSRERGYFGRSLGKISQENQENGVFFGLPTVINNRDGGGGYILGYPFPCRDRGVQVMGNDHSYPLVLWEWGHGYVLPIS